MFSFNPLKGNPEFFGCHLTPGNPIWNPANTIVFIQSLKGIGGKTIYLEKIHCIIFINSLNK